MSKTMEPADKDHARSEPQHAEAAASEPCNKAMEALPAAPPQTLQQKPQAEAAASDLGDKAVEAPPAAPPQTLEQKPQAAATAAAAASNNAALAIVPAAAPEAVQQKPATTFVQPPQPEAQAIDPQYKALLDKIASLEAIVQQQQATTRSPTMTPPPKRKALDMSPSSHKTRHTETASVASTQQSDVESAGEDEQPCDPNNMVVAPGGTLAARSNIEPVSYAVPCMSPYRKTPSCNYTVKPA